MKGFRAENEQVMCRPGQDFIEKMVFEADL